MTQTAGTARVVLRLLVAVPGGYLLSAALVSLLGGCLSWLGILSRAEAVVCSAMLGIVLYLLVLLWAFSVHSLIKLWAMVVGGSMLGWGLLWFSG